MNPRTGQGHLNQSNNRRTDRVAHSPGTFRGMELSASDVDAQEAVEISSIRSPAKLKVDIAAKPNVTRDIEMRDHDSGFGRFAGERRQPNVVQREGVTITSSVGNMDRNVRPDSSDGTEGRHVGNVRHSTSSKRSVEGMTIEDTSGDRTVKRAARPTPAKPAKPASAPHIPDDASPKLKMAIRLCPKFPPDWNFFAKPDAKVSRIKHLGASADLLDALYAVESPAMKRILEQKYKAHFA